MNAGAYNALQNLLRGVLPSRAWRERLEERGWTSKDLVTSAGRAAMRAYERAAIPCPGGCGGKVHPEADGTIPHHGSIGWSCDGKRMVRH